MSYYMPLDPQVMHWNFHSRHGNRYLINWSSMINWWSIIYWSLDVCCWMEHFMCIAMWTAFPRYQGQGPASVVGHVWISPKPLESKLWPGGQMQPIMSLHVTHGKHPIQSHRWSLLSSEDAVCTSSVRTCVFMYWFEDHPFFLCKSVHELIWIHSGHNPNHISPAI